MEIHKMKDEELFSAITGIDANKLKPLIHMYGLIDLKRNMEALNLNDAEFERLSLFYEAVGRVNKYIPTRIPIDSTEQAGFYLYNILRLETNECFVVMYLDNLNKLISCNKLFEGTIGLCQIYLRDIAKGLLFNNAGKIIIAHNHLSDSAEPTTDDIAATKKISRMLKTIDILLVDHVIVCTKNYVSLAERGLT